MEKLGVPQTHLCLKEMIKEVDEDFDGKISFREVRTNYILVGYLLYWECMLKWSDARHPVTSDVVVQLYKIIKFVLHVEIFNYYDYCKFIMTVYDIFYYWSPDLHFKSIMLYKRA